MNNRIVVVYNGRKYYWVDTVLYEVYDKIWAILIDITYGTVHYIDIKKIRVVFE